MNTISSVVAVFERVKVPEEEKFYISPELESAERQQIISDRMERRKRTILISSQSEKDFDFGIVFRDLAPIDLMKREIIVDRHNHNNNQNTSNREVYVFAMYDDDSKNYFANRIYGNAPLLC